MGLLNRMFFGTSSADLGLIAPALERGSGADPDQRWFMWTASWRRLPVMPVVGGCSVAEVST
jgi:hypothetical protein